MKPKPKPARMPNPTPMQRLRAPGLPRWTALPLGIGAGLLSGLGYGLAATPQYAATSYVMVVPQQADSPTALGFAQAYGRVVTGDAVLAGARTAARVPVEHLRGHVQSQVSPDAPMISVTGTASSGAIAARYANAVARSLTDAGNRSAASTGVRLLVFSPASAPASPASPSTPLSAAVGASTGGLLGALALLVRPARREDPPATVPSPAHAAQDREPV